MYISGSVALIIPMSDPSEDNSPSQRPETDATSDGLRVPARVPDGTQSLDAGSSVPSEGEEASSLPAARTSRVQGAAQAPELSPSAAHDAAGGELEKRDEGSSRAEKIDNDPHQPARPGSTAAVVRGQGNNQFRQAAARIGPLSRTVDSLTRDARACL